jgi:class 3 adenylate cyclase/GNAT superfamily N-acetyltransferase
MEALTSYLPASILSYLLGHAEEPLKPPLRQTYSTCVLFADVSGFTALCEAMGSYGPQGDEYLAKHLNSYFELLVKTLASQGGDVFKFAGDALIVLWPPTSDDIKITCRRAAQCALEIKQSLQDAKLGAGVTLNVKIGVGVGLISILHVGGVFGRMEYIATGQPLQQAFLAEHHATTREVVISPQVWALISEYFSADIIHEKNLPGSSSSSSSGDKFRLLQKCVDPIRKVNIFRSTHEKNKIPNEVLQNVGKYVPSAVLPFINHHEEKWASELRRISVLFVNLGLDVDGDVQLIQNVLEAVQLAVYRYEGSLNKFLMDDKGCTVVAVFGLPPLAHEDDAVRGILSALAICARLHELQLRPAIGVSTGMAFCGVVGSRGRREYSVLGDTVNLAARLMQHAVKQVGGVVCDTATQYAGRHRLHFEDQGKITVKGKAKPISIWWPYPSSLAHMFTGKPANPGQPVSSNASPGSKQPSTAENDIRKEAEKHKTTGFQSIRSIFDSLKSVPMRQNDIVRVQNNGSVAQNHTEDEENTGMPQFHVEFNEDDSNCPATPKKSQGLSAKPFLNIATGSPFSSATSFPLSPVSPVTPLSIVGGTSFFRAASALNSNPADLSRTSQNAGNQGNHGGISGLSSFPGTPLGSPAKKRGSTPSPLLNSTKNLMAEIHSFQMQGYARKHFETFKKKQEKKAKNGELGPLSSGKKTHNLLSSGQGVSTPRSNQSHLSGRGTIILSNAQIQALNTPHSSNNDGENGCDDLNSRHASIMLGTELANVEDYSNLSEKVEKRSKTLSKETARKYSLQLQQERRHSLDDSAAGTRARTGSKLDINLNNTKLESLFDAQDPSTTETAANNNNFSNNNPGNTDNSTTMLIHPALALAAASQSLHLRSADSSEDVSLQTSTNVSRRPSVQLNLNRIKTIHILLPDTLGTLQIDSKFIHTTTQLKHEIWQLGQSQQLWPPNTNENDFLLFIYDENSKTANFQAESAAVANLRIPDECSFVEMEDFIGNFYQAGSKEGTKDSNSRGYTVNGVPSSVTLLLQQGSEEFRTDQMRKHKDLLLLKIQTLVSSEKGGTVIIEGDVGLGKSRLLYATINESNQNIFCGAGNPFEMNRAYSVWRDIYIQIIDAEIERLAINNPNASVNSNRRKLIESKLKLRRSYLDTRESLDSLAPVLNEVLQLDFPENEQTRQLDSSMRASYAYDLLLVLMQLFASLSPVIIVIDDAVFLDAKSWSLVLGISKEVPQCLLILATRPINKSYMAAFATEIPSEYTELIHNTATTLLTLQPRADEVVYHIACECLGDSIDEIPPALAHLILKKAHGNPLVVKELIYALKKDKLIEIEALPNNKKQIHISPLLAVTNLNEVHSIPVPITLQCILGCRIDRLTHIQRMILKCAAIIGDEFTAFLIRQIYPLALESEKQFENELNNLLAMNILAQNENNTAHNGQNEAVYSYTNGFIRDLLLSRMLEYQKRSLEETLIEVQLNQKKKQANSVLHSDNLDSKIVKSGNLLIKLDNEYVLRYFVLVEKLLCVFESANHFHSEPAAPTSPASPSSSPSLRVPSWLIFLDDSDIHEDDLRSNGFVLTSNLYMKSGEFPAAITAMNNTSSDVPSSPQHARKIVDNSNVIRREFFLAALSVDECSEWGAAFIQQFQLDLQQIENMKRMSGLMINTLKKLEEQHQQAAPLILVDSAQETPSHTTNSSQNHKSLISPTSPSHSRAKSAGVNLLLAPNSAANNESKSPLSPSGSVSATNIDALSEEQKSPLARVFVAAIDRREYAAQCAVALLLVKKQRQTVFGGEWKKRYVLLTDELLAFSQTKPNTTDPKYWKRPTQCVSLCIGNPIVRTAGYDSSKKVHIVHVEADLYSKHKEIIWGRRTVVLGCISSEDAKQWQTAIHAVINSRQIIGISQQRRNSFRVSVSNSNSLWHSALKHNTHTTRKGLPLRPSIFAALNSPSSAEHKWNWNLPSRSRTGSEAILATVNEMPRLSLNTATAGSSSNTNSKENTPNHLAAALSLPPARPASASLSSISSLDSKGDSRDRSATADPRNPLLSPPKSTQIQPNSTSNLLSPAPLPAASLPLGSSPSVNSSALRASKAEQSSNDNEAVLASSVEKPSEDPIPESFLGLQFKAVQNLELALQFAKEVISATEGEEMAEKLITSMPGGFAKHRELYNLASVHVFLQEKLIGQVDLGASQLNSSNGHIYFFYLTPEFRGKGYGAKLEQWACTVMSRKGYSSATLLCSEKNPVAKGFYEKHGWTVAEPHPTRPHTLIMQKSLASLAPQAQHRLSARRLSYDHSTNHASLNSTLTSILSMEPNSMEPPDNSHSRDIESLFSDALTSVESSEALSVASLKAILEGLKVQVKQSTKATVTSLTVKFAKQVEELASNMEKANSGGANTGGQKLSIAEMVDACDIDEDTKDWLASTYTQENRIHKTPKTNQSETLNNSNISDDSNEGDEDGSAINKESVPASVNVYSNIDLSKLDDWDFNIFDYDPADLHILLSAMFERFDFYTTMKVSRSTMTNFFHSVRKNYFDQYYHNFQHGVDVCQTAFAMLVQMLGTNFLNATERFCLLIGGLCHDLKHPGLNNVYQVNARTPLAMLYNDQSVLEHHHAATCFRILEDPKCNILANLTTQEYKAVRAAITGGILAVKSTPQTIRILSLVVLVLLTFFSIVFLIFLAVQTDMTVHFVLIEKMNALLENKSSLLSKATPFTELADADRTIIFNVILHACDISNPAKLWPVQKRWSDAVLQEFFAQGDLEKKQGLQVSPNMDRDTTEQPNLSINFIDFIVAPLFVSVRQLLSNVDICCNRIKDNRNEWAKILSKRVEASNKSRAEKALEKARWIRRTESFHMIMLPPEVKKRVNTSNQQQQAAGSAARRKNSIIMLNQFALANKKDNSPLPINTVNNIPATIHEQQPRLLVNTNPIINNSAFKNLATEVLAENSSSEEKSPDESPVHH